MRAIEQKGTVQAKDLVPGGTLQEARFVECTEKGIHMMPDGTFFKTDPSESTKATFLRLVESTGYVVFLIRPDGG